MEALFPVLKILLWIIVAYVGLRIALALFMLAFAGLATFLHWFTNR